MAKEPEKTEFRYIQFPLCGLQEIIKDRRAGLNLVLGFGIFNYAKKLKKPEFEDVARQLIYDFYKNPKILTESSKQKLAKHYNNEDLVYNEDYSGFGGTGGEFEPDELSQVVDILKEDPCFAEDAELHFRIHAVVGMFGLKSNVTDQEYRDRYEKLKRMQSIQEVTFGHEPMPSFSKEILMMYLNGIRSESPIEWLLMFVAIKSFIGVTQKGENAFTGTYKIALLKRMIGVNLDIALPEALKIDKCRELYEKYHPDKHRRKFDNLIKRLLIEKLIRSKMGHNRQIWISTKLDHKQLPVAVKDFCDKRNFDALERESRKIIKGLEAKHKTDK